jgi:hypothetical protein
MSLGKLAFVTNTVFSLRSLDNGAAQAVIVAAAKAIINSLFM